MLGEAARQIKSVLELGESSTASRADKLRRAGRILSHRDLQRDPEALPDLSHRLQGARTKFSQREQRQTGCGEEGLKFGLDEREPDAESDSNGSTETVLSQTAESVAARDARPQTNTTLMNGNHGAGNNID